MGGFQENYIDDSVDYEHFGTHMCLIFVSAVRFLSGAVFYARLRGMKRILLISVLLCSGLASCSLYTHARAHEMAVAPAVAAAPVARNVVLMIGDGMGAEHVAAAWLCNRGKLNIAGLPVTGFSVTTSASHTITDSAAGGTAIACGCKAINGQLGLDATGKSVDSLAVQMRQAGKSTGIVVTKSVTDATPAAFYAHVKSRHDTSAIASALVDAGFDVVAGGGAGDFSAEQKAALQKKCCWVELAAQGNCPKVSERGEWLPRAVRRALDEMENDPDGLFLMVEGSKIDHEAHANDLPEVVQETLDFDKAVGVVLEWMKQHPDTLLVVTADHQTGGLSLLGGDKEKGEVKGHFSTFRHSGVSVPVYAAGAGAAAFSGVAENTEIAPRIRRAAGLHTAKN